jgi:transposase-like protein/ribosomal protein L37AE/L43A
MSKRERNSLLAFMERYGDNETCRAYLINQRWPDGFCCPKCGAKQGYGLSNGNIQCVACRYQASVPAGTVMHGSHLALRKWFLAFYLITQDKRGISAVQLEKELDVTHKTAWYLLKRVREAMGQRDARHLLSGIVEFDDSYFGGPTVGGKRGRGTEKEKVFVALSLDAKRKPQYLAMQVTENLKQKSVKAFAHAHIQPGSVIRADDYRSYPPALQADYTLRTQPYDPKSTELHWLHIIVSNAKAFILGTYHGLPKNNLQSYLNEFCFRFSRRFFFGKLFDSLACAMANSVLC